MPLSTKSTPAATLAAPVAVSFSRRYFIVTAAVAGRDNVIGKLISRVPLSPSTTVASPAATQTAVAQVASVPAPAGVAVVARGASSAAVADAERDDRASSSVPCHLVPQLFVAPRGRSVSGRNRGADRTRRRAATATGPRGAVPGLRSQDRAVEHGRIDARGSHAQ